MDRSEKRQRFLEQAALKKLQARAGTETLDPAAAGRLKIQTWMPGRRILTGLSGVALCVIAWFLTGWLSGLCLLLGILLVLAGLFGVWRTLESVFDGGVEALLSMVFD